MPKAGHTNATISSHGSDCHLEFLQESPSHSVVAERYKVSALIVDKLPLYLPALSRGIFDSAFPKSDSAKKKTAESLGGDLAKSQQKTYWFSSFGHF